MTVLENLLVAQHNPLMISSGFTLFGLLGFPRYQKAENQAIKLAMTWLERIGLDKWADEPAGSLAYGDQRRLEIVAPCHGTSPAVPR